MKKGKAAVMGMGMGMAMAMDSMDETAPDVGKVFDDVNSLIPQAGENFYEIGKEPMTAIQKKRRKKAMRGRKAARLNRK